MTNIKALEDLRVYANGWRNGFGGYPFDVETLADRIEREVSERYIELPCDAYGVPIRPDDLMACTAFDTNDFDGKEHVMAVGNGFWVDKDGLTHIPSETRHVKPRTVEDVLYDVMDSYASMDFTDDTVSTIVERYADEIREVLGGVE